MAQDSDSAAQTEQTKPAALTGFDCLKQFEGSWDIASKSPETETITKTAMQSRMLGEMWVANEYTAMFGGTEFRAVQTLGYDEEKKIYHGTWVDSMMKFTWKYEGTVDAAGTKFTLNAQGPDGTDPTVMRSYRDVYEFKSPDEIASMSQIKNEDGKWETFMEGTMKKVVGSIDAKKKMEPESNAVDSNAADGKAVAEMKVETEKAAAMEMKTVTPFLMFQGQALDAIELYKSVFPDTEVMSVTKYKAGEAGKEGTVQVAEIEIEGQRVKVFDSPIKHEFDFTPSFSFFVECKSEEELKQRFDILAKDGKVMMPVGGYGFSKQFGWVSDRFGVSWQLNLAE